MGFFSTAQNSPQAGTATRGLRELQTLQEGKRRFDIENQARLDKLTAEKVEEARMKALSQSMLGLKTYNQENVTAWAIGNNVSSAELTALAPVMKQREQQTQYVDIETDTQTGQLEKKSGKKILTNKPKVDAKLVDEEDDNFFWQRNPVTNAKTNIRQKVAGDGTGGSGSKGGIDKVADWYIKTKAEVAKSYFGDNMEPTSTQRENFDRAMSRAENLITETANAYNITPEAAVPYAMGQIRKEKNWTVQAEQALPDVNRGVTDFSSSDTETIEAVQQMQKNGVPTRIIGEALTNKGWSAAETAAFLDTAAKLVSPSAAGFNPAKLKATPVAEGQSIKDPKGVLWTRKGKYLISEDGRKVVK